MQPTGACSRRNFIAQVAWSTSALVSLRFRSQPASAAEALPPVALFSKVCQEAKLDFEGTADLVADAGLDGIDPPVRPRGQVLPERVADDLPLLAEALAKRQRRVLLLTTAIQSTATPHAEAILRTAQKLGVKYYRLGYWNYLRDQSERQRLSEIKAQLKDLAALNAELGMCAVLQNHAGTNLVGAKVRDLYDIASAFAPDQVALAFDIGHALNELPDTWAAEFKLLQSHFRVPYIKDWTRSKGFVPFGTGDIGGTEFFKLLKSAPTLGPVSMHTEYHWETPGDSPRASLLAALRRDLNVVKRWWQNA